MGVSQTAVEFKVWPSDFGNMTSPAVAHCSRAALAVGLVVVIVGIIVVVLVVHGLFYLILACIKTLCTVFV